MLSDTGELLNVVTCSSGNISVFRAHSAADLRPYQRALAGVPTKERFVITLDGSEYSTGAVSMVGFGEGAIKSDMSTREYLIDQGASEESVDALLLSFGLERYADAACSTLPADEERRTRLLAATLQPHRAIIANEPFEPISSQWRERAADILSSCARSQGGLIVIPSLSFRPEGWIDNPAVARIQVGQTLQKTIGFGAAGSSANDLMEELKKRVRAENPDSDAPALSAAAASAAVITSPTESIEAVSDLAAKLNYSKLLLLPTKTKVSLGAAAVTCVALVVALPFLTTSSQQEIQPALSGTHYELLPSPPVPQAKDAPVSLPRPSDAPSIQAAALANQAPALDSEPAKKQGIFVLDGYPVQIKEALLATVHGTPSDDLITQASMEGDGGTATAVQKNGNLFKLLEQANSSNAPANGDSTPPSYEYQNDSPPAAQWSQEEQSYENPEEAESRREAIREKFLEAIRAAAERRENEIQGD